MLVNVLLIGSGGREHALATGIAASPLLGRLFCAPGNAGIAELAECVDLEISDHSTIAKFCQANDITFVVVGPEGPLLSGIADDLQLEGIAVFGPTKAAAQLEGSKTFMKELCNDHGIPTAAYASFDNPVLAKNYVERQGAPIVIKADGLAAGKGVVVAATTDEALAAVDACFGGTFGNAGSRIVIEEFLVGEEASCNVLTDGKNVALLPTTRDYKRAFDGDVGPNTGGMGAYSPAPHMTEKVCQLTMERIIFPTIRAMHDRGTPFVGALCTNLMLTKHGPILLEHNGRFGDPEAQTLVPRLRCDVLELLHSTTQGFVESSTCPSESDVTITIVLAAQGYPNAHSQPSSITGVAAANSLTEVRVYHSNTVRQGHTLIARGGKVLSVTALGHNFEEARQKAYAAVGQIDWPDGFYRNDIGEDVA